MISQKLLHQLKLERDRESGKAHRLEKALEVIAGGYDPKTKKELDRDGMMAYALKVLSPSKQ